MIKTIYFLLLIFFILQTNILFGQVATFLDSNQINEFLNQQEIDKNVKDFYSGQFELSDNYDTYELLKSIGKKNDHFFPIYFNTLNEIVKVSDAALSEMVTKFCVEMIHNYPVETFNYFVQNKELSLEYAGFIGYELYFKERGTSSIKINFKKFREDLRSSLNLNDKNINKTFIDFMAEVERVMKNMN